MLVDIYDEHGLLDDITIQKVKQVIEECLSYEQVQQEVEVSLNIVDSMYIRKINKEYRQTDKATDVLSFPQFNSKEDFNQGSVILGDIVLAHEIVREQAKEYNHSLLREVCFLVAHGMFHLLGYDHMNSIEEQAMQDKQDYVLNKLDIRR
ncbi:MAG: rRNA maturation RNase YbeY [Epulopiscium sp. Nuni2H_MBin003]|nr:MAG: rRNA maturation RNase YbeY [Epulopiscium sp. Nuni2H_MBin003]